LAVAKEAGMVVVGGGLAGATAALELRKLGYDRRITVVAGENHLPYNRPPMSKTFLRSEETFEQTLVAQADRYAKREVELLLGRRALKIEVDRHVVQLDGQDELPYDKLLVATGGRKRQLPFAGSELRGVYDLRTVEDSEAIKAAAEAGGRAVVIGLGFIGCEVAASLNMLGVDVVALEPAEVPLQRVLGKEVGEGIAALHRRHGNRIRSGEGVERLEGVERVERVVTNRDEKIDCDFVVIGIGVEPNVDLLREAGAAISDGVDVDSSLHTSLPDVFAAGDIANHDHPVFGRIRVEHWNNADQSGRTVAAAMLGREVVYDYIHSFWSDQFDKTVEYVGFARRWDRVEVQGSIEDLDFIARYHDGGRLLAAAAIGRGGDPEMDDGELKQIAGQIRAAGKGSA
jgi:3-phenylpropionate/trans-cinnamate dioxygenase ferredoxin reductase subunit